jgi:error-prone DNA polymerase
LAIVGAARRLPYTLGGDQVRHGGSGPDPRETPPRGLQTRDIYILDLHIDSIKVKTRDFR